MSRALTRNSGRFVVLRSHYRTGSGRPRRRTCPAGRWLTRVRDERDPHSLTPTLQARALEARSRTANPTRKPLLRRSPSVYYLVPVAPSRDRFCTSGSGGMVLSRARIGGSLKTPKPPSRDGSAAGRPARKPGLARPQARAGPPASPGWPARKPGQRNRPRLPRRRATTWVTASPSSCCRSPARLRWWLRRRRPRPPRGLTVGIGDQSPAMFTEPVLHPPQPHRLRASSSTTTRR